MFGDRLAVSSRLLARLEHGSITVDRHSVVVLDEAGMTDDALTVIEAYAGAHPRAHAPGPGVEPADEPRAPR